MESEIKSDEIKSRESLNLRREARRKKILENAKARLERLNNGHTTGADYNKFIGTTAREPSTFSDPEVEPDVPPVAARTPIHGNDFDEIFTGNCVANVKHNQLSSVLKSRIHIILGAVLAYLLSTVRSSEQGTISIFIPVGTLIAIEWLCVGKQRQTNPMTNLFMTLCGMKSQKAGKVLEAVGRIHDLVSDIGLLIFFFGVLTFLLTCVSDEFIDLVQIK